MDSTSSGLARSLANSSGFWLRNSRPPLIELRVVSLPPTISSTTLPRYSRALMLRVASPCASIEIRSRARLGVDPLVPQPHEIAEALAEDLLALLLAFDEPARIGNGGRDVRPVAQLAPVLERKVEQRRQHLRGEFDRDPVHPVEGLAARQAVQRRRARGCGSGPRNWRDSPARRSAAPPCAAPRAWAGPWR